MRQADWREYDEYLLQGLEVNHNILITCQACPYKISSFMVVHACMVRKASFVNEQQMLNIRPGREWEPFEGMADPGRMKKALIRPAPCTPTCTCNAATLMGLLISATHPLGLLQSAELPRRYECIRIAVVSPKVQQPGDAAGLWACV